jgi:hypothetical protein
MQGRPLTEAAALITLVLASTFPATVLREQHNNQKKKKEHDPIMLSDD